MTQYQATIGLEIHAELKTLSKMFCGCRNEPEASEPNANTCPVCLAHPGTLPVVNREAVRQVLRVGMAVGGALANFTEFDRKNYFYPDIPKNYQISQYKFPLVTGGMIGPVAITRIHLEEDTARSAHSGNHSLVDFNRAGVPLMELVTEPVIHDAATAVSFAREMRLLLRYLGASDANLEKGEMRIEANVSISQDKSFGTKVEVKNLNSFRAVEMAIEHEISRQTSVLDAGSTVIQETRGWDEARQRTFPQRVKEDSHDYRYFPDPDIPKLVVSEIPDFADTIIRASLPALPWELRDRLLHEFNLPTAQAEQLVGDTVLSSLFVDVAAELKGKEDVARAANYITTDLVGIYTKDDVHGRPISELRSSEFSELMRLVSDNKLSSRGAKDVLALWVVEGGSPTKIAEASGLMQISDTGKLHTIIEQVLHEHTGVVDDYKAGKAAALQFLVGQGMKLARGAANPELLREEFERAIKAS